LRGNIPNKIASFARNRTFWHPQIVGLATLLVLSPTFQRGKCRFWPQGRSSQ